MCNDLVVITSCSFYMETTHDHLAILISVKNELPKGPPSASLINVRLHDSFLHPPKTLDLLSDLLEGFERGLRWSRGAKRRGDGELVMVLNVIQGTPLLPFSPLPPFLPFCPSLHLQSHL